MIKLISKFSMISNAQFPDLSSGVYMRVKGKKKNPRTTFPMLPPANARCGI